MNNIPLESLLTLSTWLVNLHSNINNRPTVPIKAMKEALACFELVGKVGAFLLLLRGCLGITGLLESILLSPGQNFLINLHFLSP